MKPLVFTVGMDHWVPILKSKMSPDNFGSLMTKTFSDGERYHKVAPEQVGGRHAVLIGNTNTDAQTLDMYDLACALVKNGARQLSIVIPYFGYSTMERAVHPGEVVKMKTRARLFSSVPRAPFGNRAFVVDLHTDSLHYFEGDIIPGHIYARPVHIATLRQLQAQHPDMVIASTDTGRAKWVESFAQELYLPSATIHKRRQRDGVSVGSVSAAVKGLPVVVFDDMIRSGGSLFQAVDTYLSFGASEVYAIATHAVFCDGFIDKLASSRLEHLFVTNTLPTSQHPKLTTVDIIPHVLESVLLGHTE